MTTPHEEPTRTVALYAKDGFDEETLLLEAVGDDAGLQGCQLYLDFAAVKYVSGMDLGGLVGLHGRMLRLGGQLVLFNLNGQVSEVVHVTHLDRLFEVR